MHRYACIILTTRERYFKHSVIFGVDFNLILGVLLVASFLVVLHGEVKLAVAVGDQPNRYVKKLMNKLRLYLPQLLKILIHLFIRDKENSVVGDDEGSLLILKCFHEFARIFDIQPFEIIDIEIMFTLNVCYWLLEEHFSEKYIKL